MGIVENYSWPSFNSAIFSEELAGLGKEYYLSLDGTRPFLLMAKKLLQHKTFW